jgi:hypothetical protein
MPIKAGISKEIWRLCCKNVPVKCSLVWTVVEYLQELTSAQVEHELWIYAKVVRQSETRGVFLSIIRKFLAKADKHAIKPTQYIRRVVNFGLEYRYPSHENRRCLLIEGRSDGR